MTTAPVDDRHAYFDALYKRSDDPWSYETSAYEADKYARTLRHLHRARYVRVLEVGCSIGVLTQHLASRADALVAVDVSLRATEVTRARLRSAPWVEVLCAETPLWWPPGCFDLIVLSEVLYYLSRAEITCLADKVVGAMPHGGEVVMVNWLGETGTPLSGSRAAAHFLRAIGADCTVSVKLYRAGKYLHHTLLLAGGPGD